MTGIDLPRVTFITCKLVLSETIPLIRRTIALRRPRALTDIAARLFSMILVDIPPGLATPKIKAQKAVSLEWIIKRRFIRIRDDPSGRAPAIVSCACTERKSGPSFYRTK
jgi:hypothetical protein